MTTVQLKSQFRRGVRAMLQSQNWMILRDTNVNGAVYYVGNRETCETYDVSRTSCTCPDWEHRCQEENLRCKHQVAVQLHWRNAERVH
tara:strand:- start:1222 stop:1485 length:264 start_codon:yes stop_codon:yes gene_type:complete